MTNEKINEGNQLLDKIKKLKETIDMHESFFNKFAKSPETFKNVEVRSNQSISIDNQKYQQSNLHLDTHYFTLPKIQSMLYMSIGEMRVDLQKLEQEFAEL